MTEFAGIYALGPAHRNAEFWFQGRRAEEFKDMVMQTPPNAVTSQIYRRVRDAIASHFDFCKENFAWCRLAHAGFLAARQQKYSTS